MALIGIFLFVSPNLAQKAYRLSLLGTGCSSLCSLYAFYGVMFCLVMHLILCSQILFSLKGRHSSTHHIHLTQKPRVWTLPVIQSWLHSIFPTKDFICFLYCLILVTSRMHFKCEYQCISYTDIVNWTFAEMAKCYYNIFILCHFLVINWCKFGGSCSNTCYLPAAWIFCQVSKT